MTISALGRCVLYSSAAMAMLTGCGGSQPPMGVPLTKGARPSVEHGFGTVFALSRSGKETVLHSFGGGSGDGANPYAGLLNVNGTFYGTTQSGGAYNGGTVFAITSSGTETVLYSFGASGDGADPMAGLINVDGTLYGTTRNGGIVNSTCGNGCGTVFSITTSGSETVLHSFEGYPSDGAYPAADLLNVNGTLYGTTAAGGSSTCGGRSSVGCGTVFAITASGESVLFSFGTRHDDCCPSGGLVDVDGTLYGTTLSHFGKVFKISTSGNETPIYRFKNYPNDGAKPHGGLIDVNGTLYGTTQRGGAAKLGTVFAVTTSGTETELYSFVGGANGGYPYASLINVNGTLYGTASKGGIAGGGAVFAITTSGSESAIYSFRGYPYDGDRPYSGLINVEGTLYGTTEYGGVN
jgi:uncharacterized repeat protein (TIGR03803 family)